MQTQDVSKFISKKTSVVIAAGVAILRAEDFDTKIVLVLFPTVSAGSWNCDIIGS